MGNSVDLSELFTKLDQNIEVNEKIGNVLDHIIGRSITVEKSPPIGRGYTRQLFEGQVISIAPMDLSRHRLLLSASVTDVFIGERSQLSGDLGFIIPSGNGANVEINSTQELFAVYKPSAAPGGTTALLSVWSEKWGE